MDGGFNRRAACPAGDGTATVRLTDAAVQTTGGDHGGGDRDEDHRDPQDDQQDRTGGFFHWCHVSSCASEAWGVSEKSLFMYAS